MIKFVSIVRPAPDRVVSFSLGGKGHCKDNHFRENMQMIRQELYIPQYDWLINCYFAVDDYYIDEIAKKLHCIGCRGKTLERAVQNMASCKLDMGLCYSNMESRESVLVTSLTSSSAQFLNSLTHEISHVVEHISTAYDINPKDEEPCYIAGDIALRVYPYVKELLCEHCRRAKHITS